MLVGDAILDEYVYVTPLGLAAKENILAARREKSEVFQGGVYAAARHVREFCKDVTVETGSQLVTKTRFVQEVYLRKLGIEIHDVQDCPKSVQADYSMYDVVIVTDFGHGCVSNSMIERLTKEAKFLAVNAQTNSANRGFNLITKYPRADYVVLDELEARLAVHDRDSPLERVVEILGFPNMVITRGVNGAFGFDGSFHYADAKTKSALDTMGAGDAFFSITAPLAAAGASMPELLAIGNAAGAAKCAVIGHREPVTRGSLEKYLVSS